MVVHKLMANQLNLLRMGFASLPPIIVLPNLEKQSYRHTNTATRP